MNITIAGDLCPVGRLSSYNSNQRIDVIVAEDIVDLIKKSQYSVVNFECPVADNSDKPIKAFPNIFF